MFAWRRFSKACLQSLDSGDGFSPWPQSQLDLNQDDFYTENHSRDHHQHHHVAFCSPEPPRLSDLSSEIFLWLRQIHRAYQSQNPTQSSCFQSPFWYTASWSGGLKTGHAGVLVDTEHPGRKRPGLCSRSVILVVGRKAEFLRKVRCALPDAAPPMKSTRKSSGLNEILLPLSSEVFTSPA